MNRSLKKARHESVDDILNNGTMIMTFVNIGEPIIRHVSKTVRDFEETTDPEILHQLRISLRKLRVVWWVFRPLGDMNSMNAADDTFKSLAKAAGDTRDWDVLSQVLSEDKAIRTATPGISRKIAEQRSHALLESKVAVGRFDTPTDLVAMFEDMKGRLGSQDHRSVGKFLKKRVKLAKKILEKRVRKAVRSKHTNYTHLHDVRKSVKKLRYIFEIFGPFLKGNNKKIIRRLVDFQKKLGSLNDLVVSNMLLQSAAFMGLDDHELMPTLKWMDDQKKIHLRSARKLLIRTGI